MAPNAITSEITCRWRDSRSMRSASLPPTPFSSPALAMAESWTWLRASTLSTSTAATPSRVALTSSRLFVPNAPVANVSSDEPAMPPRLAPAPMKPNSRLACRAS